MILWLKVKVVCRSIEYIVCVAFIAHCCRLLLLFVYGTNGTTWGACSTRHRTVCSPEKCLQECWNFCARGEMAKRLRWKIRNRRCALSYSSVRWKTVWLIRAHQIHQNIDSFACAFLHKKEWFFCLCCIFFFIGEWHRTMRQRIWTERKKESARSGCRSRSWSAFWQKKKTATIQTATKVCSVSAYNFFLCVCCSRNVSNRMYGIAFGKKKPSSSGALMIFNEEAFFSSSELFVVLFSVTFSIAWEQHGIYKMYTIIVFTQIIFGLNAICSSYLQ